MKKFLGEFNPLIEGGVKGEGYFGLSEGEEVATIDGRNANGHFL